jgi:hypothetical protein
MERRVDIFEICPKKSPLSKEVNPEGLKVIMGLRGL